MSQDPILIGGAPRSGTSLLLSLLSVHSHIYAVPYEVRAFCGPFDADPDHEFRIDFLYDHFLKADFPNASYDRWCEKTPDNVRFAGRALDYFGRGARFIHIVRDGRDVITSRHPSQPDEYYVSPERWVVDVQAGCAVEDHPQVLTVRYEDLTTTPLPELRRLCDFLGEPFEEERFRDYPKSAQFGTGDFFQNATEKADEKNEKVHRRSLKRWKKEEHAPVVDCLLSLDGAKELLRHYEYLEKGELSA